MSFRRLQVPSAQGPSRIVIRSAADEPYSSVSREEEQRSQSVTPSVSEPGQTESTEVSDFPGYPQVDIDTEELKQRAMRAVEDVSVRPGYYGKIVVYILGGVVSFTVLKAIVAAVDSLPILPGFLELVGLAYTAWFGWRYVIFKSSREELLEELDDLLGRARGDKLDEK